MSVPTKAALMYRAPLEGRVKSRLERSIGAAKALRLYRWMGKRQVSAIPSDWLVEVRYTPDSEEAATRQWLGPRVQLAPQGGGNLGERMERAAAEAFSAHPFPKLIFLGADCLGIDAAILEEANALLGTHDAVVGPAIDGGYYLLGMKRPIPELFTGIPWGGPNVFRETIDRLDAIGLSRAILPELRDVDDWESLMLEKSRFDPALWSDLAIEGTTAPS